MLEKFRVKITILASLIVTAYAYFSHQSFLKTGYAIILTIVIFYILGGFIEIFLKEEIEHTKEETEEKNEEQQEQEESSDVLENSLEEDFENNFEENENLDVK